MPDYTASGVTSRTNARTIYAHFLLNPTIQTTPSLESELLTRNLGTVFTTFEEQQAIIPEVSTVTQAIESLILTGNKSVSGSTSGLTRINFTGIYDAGTQEPIIGTLDDAFIPIPMGDMVFNFFGTNYNSSIKWNSNNALVFGTGFSPHLVSISATTAKSLLLGNYDRLCTGLYYSNTVISDCSITTIIVTFTDYYIVTLPEYPTYKYQIRLIKENTGSQRQYIEVCIITSPPSPGYSSNLSVTYPSGQDGSGTPIDSDGYYIDATKNSSYNITNGVEFLNPCGTLFQTASPPAGSSFVFSSDSTGTNWTFTNNSYVNV
jgi:hypothetical protein